MQRLPLLRVVVQWSQPLNYSPARSTSSSRLIIMPLISCSNWSLPLKYDSTIWSFIKNFFSEIVEKDFVFLKKPAVCSVAEDWEEIREERKEGERGDKWFPLSLISASGSLRWSPGPSLPRPHGRPCACRPLHRAVSSPGRGGVGWGRRRRPATTFRHCPCLPVCKHNWTNLRKGTFRAHPPAWRNWLEPPFFLSEILVCFLLLFWMSGVWSYPVQW